MLPTQLAMILISPELIYIRYENTTANNTLTDAAGTTALTGGVVGSLSGKGRQPDDSESSVNSKHGMRLGEASSAAPSGGHDQENPSRH
jgi:hypothetical protein